MAWGPIAADAGPLLHILGGDRLCGLGLPFTAVAGPLLHIPGKFCCVAGGHQFRRSPTATPSASTPLSSWRILLRGLGLTTPAIADGRYLCSLILSFPAPIDILGARASNHVCSDAGCIHRQVCPPTSCWASYRGISSDLYIREDR